jgi:transcriptional regulator with XRE-family HTH domain
MTPQTLSAWMTRLGLNKSEAASALGIARTTLDRYLSGKTAIPKVVDLACEAVWDRETKGLEKSLGWAFYADQK